MRVGTEKSGYDVFQPCAELFPCDGGGHFTGEAEFKRDAPEIGLVSGILRQYSMYKLVNDDDANRNGFGKRWADKDFPYPVGAQPGGEDLAAGLGVANGKRAGNTDLLGKGRSGCLEHRAHVLHENGKPFFAGFEVRRVLRGGFAEGDDAKKIGRNYGGYRGGRHWGNSCLPFDRGRFGPNGVAYSITIR